MKYGKKISVETKKHFGIFVILMLIIFAIYPFASKWVEKNKENRYWNGSEFVATIDCAPLIDENGTDHQYKVAFDICTAIPGNINVQFQNGYGAKYDFSEVIQCTTNYQHFELIITPHVWMQEFEEAYLSFHGTFGTGVIPTIKNVSFELYEEEENND